MFGRTRETPEPETTEKVGGKGHATPTRKAAQAATKARAKGSVDKKAARSQRSDQAAKARAGMRAGDERYLLERDKGPVRRFIRDWVDARISFMEYLLPVLIVIMALGFVRNAQMQLIVSRVWGATVILLLVDVVWLNLRLGKELKRRFPDGGTKGWRFYALMRSIQLRPLRLPKPQYKPRQKLPEKY